MEWTEWIDSLDGADQIDFDTVRSKSRQIPDKVSTFYEV